MFGFNIISLASGGLVEVFPNLLGGSAGPIALPEFSDSVCRWMVAPTDVTASWASRADDLMRQADPRHGQGDLGP